jgi:predicted RNase H-like nuclease
MGDKCARRIAHAKDLDAKHLHANNKAARVEAQRQNVQLETTMQMKWRQYGLNQNTGALSKKLLANKESVLNFLMEVHRLLQTAEDDTLSIS